MHSEPIARLLIPVMIVSLTLLLTGGCAMDRTVAPDSVAETYGSPDDELDFLDGLERRRVVTNHDALFGLLMAADQAGVPEVYEEQLAAARERGWVSSDRDLPANESARVGMIAVAVCDILEIKGGVTMRLFGPSPRYATRELVFRRILPRRTENQSMTGLEFIDLLSRVQERQDFRRAEQAREARRDNESRTDARPRIDEAAGATEELG